jgi:hypothetical protein
MLVMIEVQAQDNNGNWRTHTHVSNDSLEIRSAMERLVWIYPDARIRAVDSSGRLVDML